MEHYVLIWPLQKSRPGKKCMCVHCTLDHRCIYPGRLSKGSMGHLNSHCWKELRYCLGIAQDTEIIHVVANTRAFSFMPLFYHGGIIEVSMLKVPVLALIIETSAVWPWCRRSFQDICRGLWIIIAFAWCSPHVHPTIRWNITASNIKIISAQDFTLLQSWHYFV
jgi:hypothetical protein